VDWINSPIASIMAVQRDVYAALGSRIEGMAGSAEAAAGAIAFALLLGMIHAMTPGHGKAVVFSYFLGARARPWGGVMMALKIASTHVLSAIALVALFGSAASMFGRPSGVAKGVQVTSYALIVIVGLWLSYRAVAEARRSGVPEHRHAHDRSRGLLPFAIGLLPCPMTMLILTFAIAHATLVAGLVLTLFLGIGIAATIALVGTLGVVARLGIFARLDPSGRVYLIALNGFQIASCLAIVALGAVFLAGALS
jgi:ABC-type nickel/cobalt efflux system permease component RcnA